MAAAVGKKLQRTVAGDNGAVEWFLMLGIICVLFIRYILR
jgi:hypothetical protein